MAIEKMLNTRIQLKYDTLAHWNSSSVVLKTGELAIVTLGNNKDGSVAGAANQHPVLFKVGNGEKTFKDLPFASALAADVYSWAKAENVQLSGKTIQFVNGETVVKSVVLDYITETEVRNILKDYYTKSEVDTLLANVKTAYEAYADQAEADAIAAAKVYTDAREVEINKTTAALTAEDSRLAGLINGNTEAIDDVEAGLAQELLDRAAADKAITDSIGTVAEGKTVVGMIDTAKADAISQANSFTNTQIGNIHRGAIQEHAQRIGAVEDAIEKLNHPNTGTIAVINAAIAQEVEDRAAADALINEKFGAEYSKDNTVASAIADAKKAGTDANAALEAYKTSNNAAVALKAAQADLEAEIDRATKAEQANAAAIALLVDSTEGDETKLNSIKELATWIEEHGGEAAEMAEAIEANAGAIAQEVKDREAAVQGVQNQINALGIEDGKVESAAMADKADSLTENAKAEVKAVKVDNATNADEAAHAVNADNAAEAVHAVNADKAADSDKLGGAAAADYLKKADAPGYNDILTKTSAATLYQPAGEYASAEQGAKADTAVQPAALNDYYTKSAADAEFMNSAETGAAIDAKITALDLAATYEPKGAEDRAKSYADSLAGNYATAAQGAKADSALQEITTTANGGLKVTNKNHIDIDPDVVFVFNCGSASALID